MNKRIVWSVILVPLLVVGLIFTVGCGYKPQMTAFEVCQHVDTILNTTEQVRYTAQWAEYVGGTPEEEGWSPREKGTWWVTVKMVGKITATLIYSFNEITGELKALRVA
ncbi:MAG: hypothetical protein NT134_01335 [Chloroflexi bacterium]|nr:hypothetical protein [Chloroflexota bacterium]